MLKYAVASTGSCGNCSLFYDGNDSIVVDYGISTKRFLGFLESAMIPVESVRAIFLTHLHPDHASKSLRVLQKRIPVRIFLSACAARREHRAFTSLGLDTQNICLFSINDRFKIGRFEISSVQASHDSQGCVSYCISSDAGRIMLITDTGYFTDDMIRLAKDSRLLLLEADYDDEMLNSNDEYSYELKMRIRSELGHLSNDQARRFLLKLGKSESREVLLIHLSENNNSPQRAEERIKEALPLNKSIRAIAHGASLLGEVGGLA